MQTIIAANASCDLLSDLVARTGNQDQAPVVAKKHHRQGSARVAVQGSGSELATKKRIAGECSSSHCFQACWCGTTRAKKNLKKVCRVYKQSLYTRIVVVVNGVLLLWKTRLTPKKSSTYGPDKAVHHWRVEARGKLDKISGTPQHPGSAQIGPVDIKRVIHRLALDFRLRSGILASTNDGWRPRGSRRAVS